MAETPRTISLPSIRPPSRSPPLHLVPLIALPLLFRLPPYPLPNRAPRPPNFAAGAPPTAAVKSPFPATSVSAPTRDQAHLLSLVVAHPRDIFIDFICSRIDADVHVRPPPPPRATPAAPPRRTRTSPTPPPRHLPRLVALHFFVALSRRRNHWSAHALDVRAVSAASRPSPTT